MAWGKEANPPLEEPCSSQGVYLSAAAQFGKSNADSEGVNIPEFQNLALSNDGVYNENNARVMLSAGTSVDDGAKAALEQIDHLLRGNLDAIPSMYHEPAVDWSIDDIWKESDEGEVHFDKDTNDNERTHPMEEDNKWFPYENKTVFFLDLLDSLPRLRMSDDQMKAVLWVMKECGTEDVPSFYKLRKAQDKLRTGFLATQEHISISGKHFFANDPVEIIQLVSS